MHLTRLLQRIASPDSLNDENEFKFKLDYEPSQNTADLLTQVVSNFRKTKLFPPNIYVAMILKNNKLEEITKPLINSLIQNCRDGIGVTSFSTNKEDTRLWDEYGGKGNGVCIEIDTPDSLIGQIYHEVKYVSEKIFHVDTFLEAALFHDKAFQNYRNILLTKTKK
jgi:hypothetical protein